MRTSLIIGFLLMLLSGWAYADKQLDKETLEALIKGNTVEGKRVKWKTTYKMYFDPSGKYRRIDSLNNKEGGDWRVEKDGKLTMIGRKEHNRIVKQRSDGGYDVYNKSGQVVWTMDKITPGNPYDLVPPTGSFILVPK
jgi:hypothetical protein